MNFNIDPRLPMSGRIDIQLDYARELFAAMTGDGDKLKNQITIDEVVDLRMGDTFEQFLAVNNMITYEEVSR